MTQQYLYSIWGIQKTKKTAENFEHHFSPKKHSSLSHIISPWTLFPSGYLLFFSFCCILTLLNLPLPHEISQISKESKNTIAYIGQHSNQHWCLNSFEIRHLDCQIRHNSYKQPRKRRRQSAPSLLTSQAGSQILISSFHSNNYCNKLALSTQQCWFTES